MAAGATVAWVNGRFVAAGEGLSPLDQGFLLGLGLFETLGAVADRLPLWDRHLARLGSGAERLGIPFDPPAGLREAGAELLRRRAHEGQILRITLTPGAGDGETWCLTTRQREHRPEPLRLHVSRFHRAAGDPTAGLKSTSYAFFELAQQEARGAGADEALLLDARGHVLETATGNVFFQRQGRLCTPGTGSFLPGIARQVLLEELTAAGMVVEEGDYTLAELLDADAIFVTNAVHGPRTACLADRPPPAAEPEDNSVVCDLLSLWRRGLER